MGQEERGKGGGRERIEWRKSSELSSPTTKCVEIAKLLAGDDDGTNNISCTISNGLRTLGWTPLANDSAINNSNKLHTSNHNAGNRSNSTQQ